MQCRHHLEQRLECQVLELLLWKEELGTGSVGVVLAELCQSPAGGISGEGFVYSWKIHWQWRIVW